MKNKLITLTIATLITTGCASNGVHTVEEGNKSLGGHVEKSSLARTFCEGSGFKHYHENSNYYIFTCKDGSHFSLKKK